MVSGEGERTMTRERAILVGVALPHRPQHHIEEDLDELADLVDTAGGEVVRRVVQVRPRIHAATYIGRGKAEEIAALCAGERVALVVFDDDLSPAQARNLESIFGCRVTDRTGVILDIFARRARTREARTQVELAQYTYLLPRLTRAWSHLSRQAGGIGTRGVGETQLETDRRVIRKRIAFLKRELAQIAAQRDVQRRRRSQTFEIALVGYTNVGKSSLMNRMTSAEVAVEDRLFSTLDTTFRRLHLDGFAEDVLLIDTVGLVRKLPHHLIASFRSTMEQIREASLILHVIDASEHNFEEKGQTAMAVMGELHLDSVPVLTVFNKTDTAPAAYLERARNLFPEALFVSARNGTGIPELKGALTQAVRKSLTGDSFFVPYALWPRFASFRDRFTVLRMSYGPEGVRLAVRGSSEDLDDLRALLESKT